MSRSNFLGGGGWFIGLGPRIGCIVVFQIKGYGFMLDRRGCDGSLIGLSRSKNWLSLFEMSFPPPFLQKKRVKKIYGMYLRMYVVLYHIRRGAWRGWEGSAKFEIIIAYPGIFFWRQAAL